MKRAMNFTVKVVKPPDLKWGGKDADGQWFGIIGMLHRGDADLSASALSLNLERKEAVHFIQPMYR